MKKSVTFEATRRGIVYSLKLSLDSTEYIHYSGYDASENAVLLDSVDELDKLEEQIFAMGYRPVDMKAVKVSDIP